MASSSALNLNQALSSGGLTVNSGGSSNNPVKPVAQPIISSAPSAIPPAPAPTNTGTGTDYYTQALSLLQPSINAQIQPYQSMLANLPSIASTTSTGLTNEANTIQNEGNTEQQALSDQAAASGRQIRTQGIAQLGQQRANNAASGFASTSGIEQSQEGNISQGIASSLYNLDTQTADESSKITAMTQEQIQPILNQIALLPQEQAQQALQIGAQIAQIQGQGSGTALTYAGTMAGIALQSAKLGLDQETTTNNIITALTNLAQKATPSTTTTTTGGNILGIPTGSFGGKTTSATTTPTINPNTATQIQTILQNLLQGTSGGSSSGGAWQ